MQTSATVCRPDDHSRADFHPPLQAADAREKRPVILVVRDRDRHGQEVLQLLPR